MLEENDEVVMIIMILRNEKGRYTRSFKRKFISYFLHFIFYSMLGYEIEVIDDI